MTVADNVVISGNAKKLRFYHVRNWLGMPLSVWLPLLVRNRFAVTRVGQALRMLFFATGNSLMHRADQLIYSGRVRRAPAPEPPLFVVGHWRTGTTMLHELLVQDEQFAYPTTYQVMGPHHFLLSERLIPKLIAHAMPARRPMDNMVVGFDKPQEDEFALCNLGLPSPYLKWAFPRHYPEPGLYLDVDGWDEAERRRWIDGMVWFMRRLAWRDRRRMVLKSPTHTARLATLSEAFPSAQFIHIVRDPYTVFASTVHTWKQLWESLAFHSPNFDGIEEYVLATFEKMYHSFERARRTISRDRLYEIRYEDLVREPIAEMEKVYGHLRLKDFTAARPRLEAYFAARRDYRTNRHEISEDLRAAIAARWSGYIRRYGYEST